MLDQHRVVRRADDRRAGLAGELREERADGAGVRLVEPRRRLVGEQERRAAPRAHARPRRAGARPSRAARRAGRASSSSPTAASVAAAVAVGAPRIASASSTVSCAVRNGTRSVPCVTTPMCARRTSARAVASSCEIGGVEHVHVAGRRQVEPGEQVQQRRLAGARAARDRRQPARLELEREVVQHGRLAVRLREADGAHDDLACARGRVARPAAGRAPRSGSRGRARRARARRSACRSRAPRDADPAAAVDDGAPVLGADAAVADLHDAVGDGGGARIVADEHGRRAELARERADQLVDLRRVRGVELAGRLVGDEELRPVRERRADRDALLLAARELRRAARPGDRAGRRGRAGRRRRCSRVGAVDAEQREAQRDELARGQLRRERARVVLVGVAERARAVLDAARARAAFAGRGRAR